MNENEYHDRIMNDINKCYKLFSSYNIKLGNVYKCDAETAVGVGLINTIKSMKNEIDRLSAENELLKHRVEEIDLHFGKLLLTMQASVIEMNHGGGHEAAMTWIFNALLEPGELVSDSEKDAELYFARESKKIDDKIKNCMEFFYNNRGRKNE